MFILSSSIRPPGESAVMMPIAVNSPKKGIIRLPSTQIRIPQNIAPGYSSEELKKHCRPNSGNLHGKQSLRLMTIAKKSKADRSHFPWAGLLVLPTLLLLPNLSGRSITEADRQHWAFQPLKPVQFPEIQSRLDVQNPIDRFILFQLQTNHLQLAPRASKERLIRRVSFDLVGLPPTIEEIDAFINDSSPRAYEKLLDRLLASPHYGERWGRHWLDLARFAESDGFEHDAVRPHSWRYREYVIRSFNADKPYDRFILEQLAGDELFPNDPDALIATGFNLLGPDMTDAQDQEQRRHNTLNDITDTTALVFLGQTLGCARCHNHKFEPFSQ